MCLVIKLTIKGGKEGDFVGHFDGGEVPLEGLVGEVLCDLLRLSDGEVEGDCKNNQITTNHCIKAQKMSKTMK